MTRAFRLCRADYLPNAFSGEGARLYGGRWNSAGTAMVYTSSSLSLATLEILVHLGDPEVFSRHFGWLEVLIPDDCIEVLAPAQLPAGWDAEEIAVGSQQLGDRWLGAATSAALAVPSVVTPGELNYLLNPAHPRFAEIRRGTAHRFRPDPRLLT
jgi:RES domain-containing protein